MEGIIAIVILLLFILFVVITIPNASDNKCKREDVKRVNAEKMARLRELKAKKKIEEEKAAERARLEKIKREEDARKESERIERLRKKEIKQCKASFEKLGLTDVEIEETDEYLYEPIEKWAWNIRGKSNENIDINQLFNFLHANKDLYSAVSIVIQSSTEQELSFTVYSDQSLGVAKKGDSSPIRFKSQKSLEKYVWCFCENEKIKVQDERLTHLLLDGVSNAQNLDSSEEEIEPFLTQILKSSNYFGILEKHASVHYDNEIALIEYELPCRYDFSWIREYKYVQTDNTVKESILPEATIVKTYESLIYSICLRSIYELCVSRRADEIKSVVFNGYVSAINKANGLKERKCIISLQVAKDKFLKVDLLNVDPKLCFKSFKGVSAARLIDVSPVQPVLTFNKNDKRFIQGKDVHMNSGTNLASMDWEDFEHLVRDLFEMEFAKNGGEVRVTQASRDGGVDAIIFDPDPLRGGKIVIQAKRYTNTVGVSAVRDLYGTVINEGANTGILITTSDYGHDSYEFAKDKPLKLLNGGHLLALLHKNGKEGYINIQEAKENLKED